MSTQSQRPEDYQKSRVLDFCQALAGRNLDRVFSLMADNATLTWGPYSFNNGDAIIRWAEELYELFPFMSIQNKSLTVSESTVKQELVIAFLTSEKQRGWLPCVAEYSFEKGRINRLAVTLLNGYLAVSRSDVVGIKAG